MRPTHAASRPRVMTDELFRRGGLRTVVQGPVYFQTIHFFFFFFFCRIQAYKSHASRAMDFRDKRGRGSGKPRARAELNKGHRKKRGRRRHPPPREGGSRACPGGDGPV